MNKWEEAVIETHAKRQYELGGRYKNPYDNTWFNKAYGKAYIEQMNKAGKL